MPSGLSLSEQGQPLPVHDLARKQQAGWLSFGSQYSALRRDQLKRTPRDRARSRKGRGARAA